MKLPLEFLNKMHMLMDSEEYNQLIKSFDKPRCFGLRVNTLKIEVDRFKDISPFSLEPVPWASDGFYYPESENPGRHPYYYAGLYYIQEPSAMFPGAIIGARPGEKILDLCAAPGGKTVQMAAGMKGRGIIIANDINSERVKALVKNIELCGVRNAVVINETPLKLAQKLKGYFDKILVDAPCSGEGMFRKDPEAVRSWENYKCDRCSDMQWDILQHADVMLKPGGRLVYSTCTFSPEEDERIIARFLEEHREYRLVDIPKTDGIEDGRPEWANGNNELKKTARLWPFRLKGEGHFAAVLEKCSETGDVNQEVFLRRTGAEPVNSGKRFKSYPDIDNDMSAGLISGQHGKLMEAYRNFIDENLNIDIRGCFISRGCNLYCLPENIPDLDGLKVVKYGWYLGELSGEKFLPSHSMAVSLKKQDFKRVLDFDSKSKEISSYLKGETLMFAGEKGFTGICVDGYTVGWAKQMGEMLKNMYPKGWRKLV